MKRPIALLTTAGLATSLLVGGASMAEAAPARAALVCETGATPVIRIPTHTSMYVGNSGNRVYGQSGGTITISYGQTWTTTGSVSLTAGVDAGVIFSKVSASVGVSVAKSKGTTATSSYSWKVPAAQKTGWVERGNYGYTGSWQKGHYKSPCTWVTTASGSYKGVTKTPWYTHS